MELTLMTWLLLLSLLSVISLLVSFLWTVEADNAYDAIQQKKRQAVDQPIADLSDPVVRKAMAELDEIDEVLGILPERKSESPFGLKPDWEMMDTMTMRSSTPISKVKPGPPY